MVFLPEPLKGSRRKSAFILPKDAGLILTELPITRYDVVVEGGGGNGYLTFYLSQVAKEVHVYERDEVQFSILRENISRWGLRNVFLYNSDVREAKKKGIYVLDTSEFLDVLNSVKDKIEKGVLYLPQITQVLEAQAFLKEEFKKIRVVRVIEEEWEIKDRVARPKHKQLLHTAFLVFFWR